MNEVGDFLICSAGTAGMVVRREIDSTDPIYADLLANFFVSEKPIPDLIDVLATRYRTKKSFLDSFTCLHIFVMTLRCNHGCIYCQVGRRTPEDAGYDMSLENLSRSIAMMFMSPSKNLTVEFQGGEPLLVLDKIKEAVETISAANKAYSKNVTYVLCTNLSLLSEEALEFCMQYGIIISTSLDGPEYVHNANRHILGINSYESVIRGIATCRERLGNDRVSALMTTSEFSLGFPIQIVDEYLRQGFSSIFIRALNPFGLARRRDGKKSYSVDQFLHFYKTALLYILQLNLQGTHFVEEYARIVLSKVLTPFASGFTDLQSPNGVVNSVVAYNYDGNVYASDEARMLAEEGDYTFRLGHVQRNSYAEIFYGPKARDIAEFWANESLPGCSECGFQTYCGADPVRNYATQGSAAGRRPSNAFCKKNREIIRFLLELMSNSNDIERVFRTWLNPSWLREQPVCQ